MTTTKSGTETLCSLLKLEPTPDNMRNILQYAKNLNTFVHNVNSLIVAGLISDTHPQIEFDTAFRAANSGEKYYEMFVKKHLESGFTAYGIKAPSDRVAGFKDD